MKKIILYRNHYKGPTILGNLIVIEEFTSGGSRIIFDCKTIELAWKNNDTNISCVPTGFYVLNFEPSNKFNRDLWELKGVPNRIEAKIHVANYFTEIEGCIGVGDLHIDMNSDGIPDVRNSADTLNRLHDIMSTQSESTIHIIGRA